jgi:glycosyltransferase involved in cell wall biosynthesis
MLHCAASRPVLFVNSIGMRVPSVRRDRTFAERARRKLASVTRGLSQPVAGLPFHVLSTLTVPYYDHEWGRALNTRLVRVQVMRAMRRLHLVDPIVVVTVPTAWPVVASMRPSRLVYNRADEHATFEEADQPYLRHLEAALLDAADVVLYYSNALYERERDRVAGRAVFLDHGVDCTRFRPDASEPDPLAPIPRPRVGFLGTVRDRVVDLALLDHLARALPDVQLVLVGPVLSPLGDLAARPNVHVLGPRPFDDMPACMRALDVGLLPYLDTPWTRSANPVKMKEYLATGLAVVSTDLPAARRYAPAIRVATDSDAFVAHVRAALADAALGPRGPVALDVESWAEKAAKVMALCDDGLYPRRASTSPWSTAK